MWSWFAMSEPKVSPIAKPSCGFSRFDQVVLGIVWCHSTCARRVRSQPQATARGGAGAANSPASARIATSFQNSVWARVVTPTEANSGRNASGSLTTPVLDSLRCRSDYSSSTFLRSVLCQSREACSMDQLQTRWLTSCARFRLPLLKTTQPLCVI